MNFLDGLSGDVGRILLPVGGCLLATVGAVALVRWLLRLVFGVIGRLAISGLSVLALLVPGRSLAGVGYLLAGTLGIGGAGLCGYGCDQRTSGLIGTGLASVVAAAFLALRTASKHDGLFSF